MSLLPLGLPEPLFGGPAPRIRAAPASAPFLETLAEAMVAELARRDDPFALADALVLLPNRRAARGLIDALAKRLGGAALLPTIRPLGDPHADDDPDVWGADPLSSDILPPIEKIERRMQLASLIRRRGIAEAANDDPARAIALADELGKLLDSAATVDRVAWDKLPTLVEEIELARHWASSAAFLGIIAQYWPEHLKERGKSDPAAHGAALRRALAQRWRESPPKRPIIVAGSTGSQSTTRELMWVVAGLPRGVVVLPGVDTDLDEESWKLVGDQHPQHALKGALKALGVERDAIPALAIESAGGRARRVLMREALAPAEKTADWLARLELAGGKRFVAEGAAGLRLLEAETEEQEATAIALMLREALEKPGGGAAVVTPDARLARRIESKLARWGIEPAVSHGSPLRETDAGRLIALLCELARDAGDQVALAALLKHPRVITGRDQFGLTILEHNALRGARRYEKLEELIRFDARDPKKLEKIWPHARAIVEALIDALAPLRTLMTHKELTLAEFADALSQCAETLTEHEIWQGRDGEAAAALLREANFYGGELEAMRAHAAPRVLLTLMEGREVPPAAAAADAPIAIWGLLEARLQRRELMILAGLNEGVWPAPAGEDPFLSRAMRAKLGLPSLDARIGLAAHDFAQLANAPNVVMTRALRREGSPTLASRWLWRLKTLVQGAEAEIARADDYIAYAKALDHPAEVTPAKPVCPRPPAGKRLTQISVTQVETLIRDPYAVYARRILKLDALEPIGAPAGPAQRGTAVHAAIESFGDGDDPAKLSRLLDDELRKHGIAPERRAAERERLLASVQALIAWFAERRGREAVIYREVRGEMPVGDVLLTGVADRIEIAPGHGAILDFKTGKPPTNEQVNSGLTPQLLLEAAMLMGGFIKDVPKATPTELVYWQFGGSKPAPQMVEAEGGPVLAAEKALTNLRALLAKYADPQQPFYSKPRVQFLKPYDDYDLLARRKEWADEAGDE
ncbi:MAG TPA: double-strand break repair protein AddB [Vitreimonas sp.]|uniref:double-strand break repair protein AddB n=1 Tax=Vitreimonas sp. TaxID=3069702 RepID=UPI002D39B579|nr:double-strand break repair protein AddB [Vitreimonas sp.]HYD86409.1 double-strand break repair protein AddB [Vitreimonas sp.]